MILFMTIAGGVLAWFIVGHTFWTVLIGCVMGCVMAEHEQKKERNKLLTEETIAFLQQQKKEAN